jgi:hypothetical protein
LEIHIIEPDVVGSFTFVSRQNAKKKKKEKIKKKKKVDSLSTSKILD